MSKMDSTKTEKKSFNKKVYKKKLLKDFDKMKDEVIKTFSEYNNKCNSKIQQQQNLISQKK